MKKMNYQEIDQKYYLPAYNRFPVTIEKGSGSWVWDTDGKKYIDALAGIAVTSLGHSHPKVLETLEKQARKLMHVSNFFLTPPQAELSVKLAEISGLERVFFANSGAEANEGAVKIARKYAHSKGRGGEIISFSGCFHGRTMATLAMGKGTMQQGFEPIPGGFTMLPFNDLEAVSKHISQETAAVIVEPIQGEGGIRPASKAFLQGLRKICDENDVVLIFDEIQCGMGRTGYFFAKDFYEVEPDMITSAKALGSGMPVSAIMTCEKVAKTLSPGDHGTTFGGNALATAVALTTIQVMEEEGLLQQAREKGKWFRAQLETESRKTDIGITEIRGAGLMIGLEFDIETKPIVDVMLQYGVIANATAGNVLRIVPPLNISYQDLKTVMDVIIKATLEVKKHV
jgi:acetylornithine/N-succinyldiaminopimelate aminotransferase